MALRRFRGFLSAGVDQWLDRSANIAIVVVPLVVASAALSRPPQRVQAQGPPDYKSGDVLNSQKLGLRGAGLVLVTRSTCPACTASLPFYRSLDDVTITAVSDEPIEVNRQYLATNGVKVRSLMTLADAELNVRAVPTLIAVRGDGRVVKAWRGKLTKDQETEVTKTMKGAMP